MSTTIGPSHESMRSDPPASRRDLGMWLVWAAVVAVASAFGIWALHVLVNVPAKITPWWEIGLSAFAVPLLAMAIVPLRRLAGPVLRATVVLAGLVTMVLAVYLIVIVGLGDDVGGTEHRVVWLSMVAGASAVALAGPVRSRLRDLTRSTTDQQRPSAVAALGNFGARMTRAVPMDELLLQLTETLQATMAPSGAEIWTGDDGTLERAVSVPERGPGRIRLTGPELAAVTGARVSGTSWAAMWMPQLPEAFAASGEVHLRIAPITHLGGLLGLIVCARSLDEGPFRPDDDSVLADVARQVGLALHNVNLDSALQDSLEELKRKNRQLEASRERIVTAADESRRKIERDLHDGAQQQLVALAMKVQIARRTTDDPEALSSLLEDLGEQVQHTIDELRELAHGIYPPLLRDQGLGAALRRAAARASLPAEADVETDRRYDPGVEAAVYFCCLEAMQNAGKYAGPDAHLTIEVTEDGGMLRFEVSDDGAGFDVSEVSESHGFVNMRDRVGAYGGELTVTSSPGHGTTIRGVLPVPSSGPAESPTESGPSS